MVGKIGLLELDRLRLDLFLGMGYFARDSLRWVVSADHPSGRNFTRDPVDLVLSGVPLRRVLTERPTDLALRQTEESPPGFVLPSGTFVCAVSF